MNRHIIEFRGIGKETISIHCINCNQNYVVPISIKWFECPNGKEEK